MAVDSLSCLNIHTLEASFVYYEVSVASKLLLQKWMNYYHKLSKVILIIIPLYALAFFKVA